MSLQLFGYALVVAAAVLAIWIMARFTGFGPRSLVWAGVHLILAIVLLRLVPVELRAVEAIPVPGQVYVEIFAVALPLLVYGFLAGGWMTRVGLGLLRP